MDQNSQNTKVLIYWSGLDWGLDKNGNGYLHHYQ